MTNNSMARHKAGEKKGKEASDTAWGEGGKMSRAEKGHQFALESITREFPGRGDSCGGARESTRTRWGKRVERDKDLCNSRRHRKHSFHPGKKWVGALSEGSKGFEPKPRTGQMEIRQKTERQHAKSTKKGKDLHHHA